MKRQVLLQASGTAADSKLWMKIDAIQREKVLGSIHPLLGSKGILCSRVPIIFEGRVVGVQDGDTITVLDSSNANHRIRLLGIDAPEEGQSFGTQSKQNPSEAVFNKVVTIEWLKHDRYGRIVGKVLLNGRDACLDQVTTGMAWHYKYYQDDQTLEDRQLYAAAEIADGY